MLLLPAPSLMHAHDNISRALLSDALALELQRAADDRLEDGVRHGFRNIKPTPFNSGKLLS